MTPLEAFNTAGSIIAICVGLFTVYDRFFRHQPIVAITARLNGVNAATFLRIKNVAPLDIYIENITVNPPVFGIAVGSSTRAMADLIMFKDTTALLMPNEDHLFHLVFFDAEKAAVPADQIIQVTVNWRRSESSYLKRRPVILKTSVNDIKERERAVIRSGPRI